MIAKLVSEDHLLYSMEEATKVEMDYLGCDSCRVQDNYLIAGGFDVVCLFRVVVVCFVVGVLLFMDQ